MSNFPKLWAGLCYEYIIHNEIATTMPILPLCVLYWLPKSNCLALITLNRLNQTI